MSSTRYVFLLDQIEGVEATKEQIKEHIQFLRKLEKDDVLELAGPFTDYPGGVVIIKARSLDEATKIANSDPFVKNKLRRLEIRTLELSHEENNHLGMG